MPGPEFTEETTALVPAKTSLTDVDKATEATEVVIIDENGQEIGIMDSISEGEVDPLAPHLGPEVPMEIRRAAGGVHADIMDLLGGIGPKFPGKFTHPEVK
jgi:hypothetical protein